MGFRETGDIRCGRAWKYWYYGDMRTLLAGFIAILSACTSPATEPAAPAPRFARGALVARDAFAGDRAAWIVEQQPGGSVAVRDGALVIDDAGGCTVWFRQRLDAPVIIACKVMVSSASRVSDMNFFWMASDPSRPADLFAEGHARSGAFATYDTLRTYYVGYGGNTNTTTRFRRYTGTGARPLLPGHDLAAPEFLLQADHIYDLELIAAGGHAQFVRDGEVIFDFQDPQPLESGWFGFRTVHSRIVVTSFAVYEAKAVLE